MIRALLIVNPVSGTLRARESLFGIADELTRRGVIPTVVMTRKKNHARSLAASAARAGFGCVVCVGGDGTLNEVIAGLVSEGSRLPVGYIPTGSTNDFAGGLGLELEPVAAARDVARAAKAGVVMPVDVGGFGDSLFFSYIASFGAFTSSSYSAPQQVKNLLGHMAYVLQGVKDFFQIAPIHAVCVADGVRREGDYVFGGICNTFSVGGIVKLGSDMVKINDGLFEVVLVKAPRDVAEFNSIVTAVMSSTLDSEMIEFFRAKELEITLPEGTAWSLDGEKAVSGGTTKIVNLKGALPLLHMSGRHRKK
ncbi:MAG: YegS/Rv2252/BmrU family lipid kinase [Clostridia bacterium]|nr:YegS/Rv2252/BmrU family lipid kinase [Clostridia bacterium]